MIETSEVTVSIPQLLLEAALVYDMGKKVKSPTAKSGVVFGVAQLPQGDPEVAEVQPELPKAE